MSVTSLYSRMTAHIVAIATMFVVASCGGRKGDVVVSELQYEAVCQIDQGERMMGQPIWLCMMDDSRFLLCTNSDVLLFGIDGKFIREIGRPGRAAGEYNMPMIVKAHGDTVYVWSAMDLKFVAFDSEGGFIDEYPYDSAMDDFLPMDGKIHIYPVGMRGSHLVDVYDMDTKSVVQSLTETSAAHRICHWMSTAPLSAGKDGKLCYMSRTELTVHQWDAANGDGESEEAISFSSPSFIVPSEEDAESMVGDSSKWAESNNKTSFVVAMEQLRDGRFIVLTSEGRYVSDGKSLDDSGRFFSLYEVKSAGKARCLQSFPAATIKMPSLTSFHDGDLFFIKHSAEGDDDSYSLCRVHI